MSTQIPIDKIVKGRNPRKHIDLRKLEELALSIKEEGLIQAILRCESRNFVFINLHPRCSQLRDTGGNIIARCQLDDHE